MELGFASKREHNPGRWLPLWTSSSPATAPNSKACEARSARGAEGKPRRSQLDQGEQSPAGFRAIPVVLVIAAFLVALGAAAILAPTALAAKKYVQIGQFPPEAPANHDWKPTTIGELLAESVAVSDKNDHIYVADSGRGSIFDYSSSSDKEPSRWSGTNTPEGSFGEHVSVAVDNTTGDVYVACREHHVIDKFDENGNLIASFGDATPSHTGQLTGLETPAKSFAPPSSYYSSFPIAVDQATHDLYVADPGHEVIDVFDKNGVYLRQITAKPTGLYSERGEYTTGIAVTTAGNVYVSDWNAHEVFQFNSAGNYVSSWNGGNLPNGAASKTPDGDFGGGGSPLEVTAEDSTGHVFVNNWGHSSVDIFDENGNFLPPQILSTTENNGSRHLENVEGVSIDQATGYLYASSDWSGSIEIFNSIIVPDISVGPASATTTTGATLNGHVDPATGEGGGAITECHFEYLTVYQFAQNSGTWNGATQVPCSPNPTTSAVDVSANVTGLAPGTEYRVRLVAANSEGGNSAPGPNFGTEGHYRLSTQFGTAGTGDGQLKEPKEVAINNENGDVYVADAGNHRVDEFSASGSFLRSFGADVGGAGVNVCTAGCQAGTPGIGAGQFTNPRFVEVDNSHGPSAGDVYVADTADSAVQKFDSSGNLLTSWSGGRIEFPKKEGTIGGITVDPAGNLYVLTDSEPFNWTEISQDGVSRNQFPTNGTWAGGEKLDLSSPGGTGIDVSANEGWYETQPAGNASYGVYYSSPAAQIYNFYGMYEPLYGLERENSGLAINRANNDLFVDQGTHIDRFAEGECIPPGHGCRPTDSFGNGTLKSTAGLAVRPSTGLLYAADSGNNDIAVFSPAPAPEVTTGPAAILSPTSASMTGHVDPGTGTISDCHFEYLAGDITNEIQNVAFSQGTKEGTFTVTFEGQTTAPIPFAAGNFTAETFQFRLEQLSTIGAGDVRVTGEETGPFKIEFKGKFAELNVPQVSVDSAGLAPVGSEATPTTRYDGNGWTYSHNLACSPPAPLSEPTDVSAELTGLTPFTNYHYRLVATRSDGEGLQRNGKERVFIPAPALTPSIDATTSGGIEPTTATLGAAINPNLAPTVYRFQYGTDTTYGDQTPLSESIGEDGADHSVKAELTGLTPGTTYHFRVVAVNLNGRTAGPDETFSTPDRPTVSATSASGLSQTAATLSAALRPGFRPTTYHFEYGRSTAYGASTPESGSIGADGFIHTATNVVSALSPGTIYHYRVVARNEIGITNGPDQSFTTAPASISPPTNSQLKCNKKGFVRRGGKCVKKRHHVRKHRHG